MLNCGRRKPVAKEISVLNVTIVYYCFKSCAFINIIERYTLKCDLYVHICNDSMADNETLCMYSYVCHEKIKMMICETTHSTFWAHAHAHAHAHTHTHTHT